MNDTNKEYKLEDCSLLMLFSFSLFIICFVLLGLFFIYVWGVDAYHAIVDGYVVSGGNGRMGARGKTKITGGLDFWIIQMLNIFYMALGIIMFTGSYVCLSSTVKVIKSKIFIYFNKDNPEP